MFTFDDLTSAATAIGAQLGGVVVKAAVAAAVAWLLYRLRALRESSPSGGRLYATFAGYAALALLAFAALNGSLHLRADTLTGALGRWDYWLLCAFVGQLLELLDLRWRSRAVGALSLVFVGSYVGPEALGVNLGACLLGWAVVRYAVRPRIAVVVHVALSIAVVGYFWSVHWTSMLRGVQGWGLACWALMRHASFVVEARRGAPTGLADYVCYLLFFPSCFDAMETYEEFSERNLTRRQRVDFRAAVLGSIRGDLFIGAALLVPMTLDAWLASSGFVQLWWRSLLLFLHGALFLDGLWAMIESDARLLGFELRHNFRNVVIAENPSRFWRAWRGTMTHWLIRYVYVPLGGNRRHQTRNIFAAFAVSTTWHVVAVLFVLPPDATGMALVPTLSWGALNFLGVAAHGAWRRRWPAGTWWPADSLATRAVKILLALCFGSLTVTVLGFPRDRVHEFSTYMCTLAGLGRVCGR
jgi:hypothetical protein